MIARFGKVESAGVKTGVDFISHPMSPAHSPQIRLEAVAFHRQDIFTQLLVYLSDPMCHDDGVLTVTLECRYVEEFVERYIEVILVGFLGLVPEAM